MTDEKVRENKMRRISQRRGFRLLKSRRRDSQAIGYGGYMIVDDRTNAVVLGANPFAFFASLEDIEEFFGESKKGRNDGEGAARNDSSGSVRGAARKDSSDSGASDRGAVVAARNHGTGKRVGVSRGRNKTPASRKSGKSRARHPR